MKKPKPPRASPGGKRNAKPKAIARTEGKTMTTRYRKDDESSEGAESPETPKKHTKEELEALIRETPQQQQGPLQAELEALKAEDDAAKAPKEE